MEGVRAVFEGLHFKNVKTYIQSGNVVFQYKSKDHRGLEKRISKKITESFGFNVPVIIKDKDDLQRLVKKNPFVNRGNENTAKLHVTFLSDEPGLANIDKINKEQYVPDEFVLSGNIIYLHCPNGYGN